MPQVRGYLVYWGDVPRVSLAPIRHLHQSTHESRPRWGNVPFPHLTPGGPARRYPNVERGLHHQRIHKEDTQGPSLASKIEAIFQFLHAASGGHFYILPATLIFQQVDLKRGSPVAEYRIPGYHPPKVENSKISDLLT